jgi:glutamate racemase
VSDSFEDYLTRRPQNVNGDEDWTLTLLTTGDPLDVSNKARVFWHDVPAFAKA